MSSFLSRFFGGFLFILGLIFLIVSAHMYHSTHTFLADSTSVMGKVIGYRTSLSTANHTAHRGYASRSTYVYAPEVSFVTKRGQMVRFVSNTSSNHRKYAINELVKVRYDLRNPQEARIDQFSNLWMGALIFFVLGGIFTAFGAWKLYRDKQQKALYMALKQTGKKVPVKFERVEIVENAVKYNGRSPYRIVAYTEKAEGVMGRTYYSKKLWEDPTPRLEGIQLYVYIDRNDPARYVMDIDFLK